MADNPSIITDHALAEAKTDTPDKDALADYRSGGSRQAKDAPKNTKAAGDLPALQLSGQVDHDEKGNLTCVRYPDGTMNQFSHDDEGFVTNVWTKDGCWSKQHDGTFELFDTKGVNTHRKLEAVQVNEKSGAVEFYSHHDVQNGKVTHYSDLLYANGTKVSKDIDPSGTSEVVTFPAGDTVTIHYGNGTDRMADKITYGANNGKDAGCSCSRSGEIWSKYDSRGNKTETFPEGSYISTGTAINTDNIAWIHYPDGGSDITFLNGNTVHKNMDNRVTQVTDLKGKTEKFDYADSGKLIGITNKDGSSWQVINDQWYTIGSDGKPASKVLSRSTTMKVDDTGNLSVVPAG